MARPSRYPPELRERAVRMLAEVLPNYPSEWPAMVAVADKLGIGTAETIRKWVRRAQVDSGVRPGVTTEELAEIKRLKREVAELRRANEILKDVPARCRAAEKLLHRGARPNAVWRLIPKTTSTAKDSMEKQVINPWTWQDRFGLVQANKVTVPPLV